MSNLIDNIKRLATLIKTETKSGANTAARIGGLFEEIGNELEQKYDKTDSDRIMEEHNTADTSHRNVQDKMEQRISNVDQSLSLEINEASKTLADSIEQTQRELSESIEQNYQVLTDSVGQTNQNLSTHSGNQEIHRTSAQIRAEIVDKDIPSTLARVADTEAKDRDTLNSAKSYTDTSVTNLGDNVYRKAETYSRPEIDNKDTATLNASKNDVTERLKGKAELSHNHTKAQITDFPTSMPANGGNADTVDGKHATEFQPAGSYATSSHNHTGVYQPTGNYAATDHTHTAGQVTGDATHRFVTDAEKTDWNSKASGAHNHDTVYANKTHDHDGTYLKPTDNVQDTNATFTPATTRTNITSGEKLSALFGKVSRWFADLKPVAFTASAADITEQANKRFMTDAGKTLLNNVPGGASLWHNKNLTEPMNLYCMGVVNVNGGIEFRYGSPFQATRIKTGEYLVTHSITHTNYFILANCSDSHGYVFTRNKRAYNVTFQTA